MIGFITKFRKFSFKAYKDDIDLTSLPVAQEIADNLVKILSPYCGKIHIAGSVRRKKPVVKDIEIVCQPKRIISTDLFGEEVNSGVDPQFRKEVMKLGEAIKGNPDSRYMQIRLPQEIKLDLFMPAADDYFRQFAMRTGSADYSGSVIAGGWVKLGWVGAGDSGLRRNEDCRKSSDGKWKVINKTGERPPVWESEEEFFEWLNVEWIEPEKRTT